MVSFHQVLMAERPITEVPAELEASSKKRKWEQEPLTEEFFKDHYSSTTDESNNPDKRKSIFDIELHLETPFPSNKLQQYLSIQSGTHLCNTRVNMKTPQDSKRSPEPEPRQMSLDLELNLTCESLRKKEEYSYCDIINEKQSTSSASGSPVSLCERDLSLINESSGKCNNKEDSSSCGLTRSPSWLSIEEGEDHKEMIATVCMRCHMLVMLCKSSPSCPNCKFMHPPPDQNPSFLKRRRCSPLVLIT